MRIIGIDSSLTGTGVAVLRTLPGVACEVHTVTAKVSTKAPSPEYAELERMHAITRQVGALDPGGTALAVLEGPSLASRNGKAHERAGLWWMLYAQAVNEWCVPVLVVRPTIRAKYATGSGNASKDHVMLAASRRYPDILMSNNNEADAVLLAAIGARLLGYPVEQLPATHMQAMRSLSLPPTPNL